MNEKSSKRRDWIKNAAIVFLSVLLVLTFFSSTIMNWSLPEVDTKYAEPGSITAKIRGSGMVESSDPYSVRLKTNTDENATGVYEVASVEVRKGDKVTAGDVLCHIVEGDSKPLQDAKDALNSKLLEYEIAILQGNVSDSVLNHAQSGSVSSMSAYQGKLLTKEQEIENLKVSLKEAQDTLDVWQRQSSVTVDTKDEQAALTKAQAAYDATVTAVNNADAQIAPFQAMIAEYQAVVDKENLIVPSVSGGDPIVSADEVAAARQNIATLQAKIDQINTQSVKDMRASIPALKAEVEKAQAALDNKDTTVGINVKDQIQKWTKEVAEREAKVSAAEAEKTQLITDIVTELQWNETLSQMKENIASLEQETVGGEVTAPVSGTITDVYVKSGEETPGSGILFTIQPEGKGFTMQFSVTNEQAKRLSVGDMADLVNSWRYDDVQVRLASIKPDTQNPGQNKMLTFDVSGDVTPGQALSVSVGQKNPQQYDLIVPNSAIREDNNGKFILIIETKSTPLNNRYIATRVDVEVLASDDTRSAISAAMNGYEYVITTATAPVAAGQQVRLTNN